MSSELAMPSRRALVLDANILVRAVLGRKVLCLLETYTGRADFLTPIGGWRTGHSRRGPGGSMRCE